jgi:hypothetical protein
MKTEDYVSEVKRLRKLREKLRTETEKFHDSLHIDIKYFIKVKGFVQTDYHENYFFNSEYSYLLQIVNVYQDFVSFTLLKYNNGSPAGQTHVIEWKFLRTDLETFYNEKLKPLLI